MLRAVLDTNVIVSGVISKKGPPAQLMVAWAEHVFNLVTSDAIISEIQRVLSEPRLKNVFNITDERIVELVEALREDSILVAGAVHDIQGAVPSDPSDEIFLAAGLDGNADVVVSGDKDLLGIESFRGIVILTPRQFLDRLESDK